MREALQADFDRIQEAGRQRNVCLHSVQRRI